jgi:hypothetical protein
VPNIEPARCARFASALRPTLVNLQRQLKIRHSRAGGNPVSRRQVCTAGAAYLLTMDKQLIKKMAAEPRVRVIDPIDFIRSQYRHEN